LGVKKFNTLKEGGSYESKLSYFSLLKIRYRMYFPSTDTVYIEGGFILISLFLLRKIPLSNVSENMIGKTFGYFLASIFLIAAVSGCAGLPGRGGIAPQPPGTEAKLLEANVALDAANEQSSAFYAQLASVLQGIREFQGRPGWSEFEQILLDYPSLRDPDNGAEITPEIMSRFSGWGLKWKTSWENTLDGYQHLVDKCIILEAKRLAVREKLLAVQAKYLGAVMAEVSAGREKEGREIFAVVEALDKTNAELDSYRTNDLGLYATGTAR
jgi:hypothetical protein